VARYNQEKDLLSRQVRHKAASLRRAIHYDIRLPLFALIEDYLVQPEQQEMVNSRRAGKWVLEQKGIDAFITFCDGLEGRVFGEMLLERMELEKAKPVNSKSITGRPPHKIYTRIDAQVIEVAEACKAVELPDME